MSEEARIDTFCGTCIFAEYNEAQEQIGCAAKDMLTRLQKQGKQVIIEEVDNHKCFKLLDTVCYYWRPDGWRKPAETEEEVFALVDEARREMTLNADIIIYCDGQSTFEDVEKTMESLRRMTLKPIQVYFANDHMVKPSQFFIWANENVTDMPWRIESILTEYGVAIRAVDAVSDKCTGRFVSVFKAGFEIPSDFLTRLDCALHDELQRFVLLQPIDDLNGLTFIRRLHNILNGSKYGPIAEQVQILSEEQTCLQMIRPVAAVVPSMLA